MKLSHVLKGLVLALLVQPTVVGPVKAERGGQKIGVILASPDINRVVSKVADIGSWYYTYGPYPDRTNVRSTLQMAFQTGKEFVPMITGRGFPLDNSYKRRCTFLRSQVKAGQQMCTPQMIETSLRRMLSRFAGHPNPPQYLMLQNEPWHRTTGKENLYKGKNLVMTPWQAAQAMARIQPAARALNLKLVSPTVDNSLTWFPEFLKRCVDDATCDIEALHAFSVHKYQCDKASWQKTYGQRGFQAALLRKMQGYKAGGMTPAKWKKYIYSRRIWVTETTCNHDPDYTAAEKQTQPQYPIRTQEQSCLRASGAHDDPEYGSLPVILEMPANKIERVAWWTTYTRARGFHDTDFAPTLQNPLDRLRAVRLFDEAGDQMTPVGRMIVQAYRDPGGLAQMDCAP